MAEMVVLAVILASANHPEYQLTMRHIRDEDGHYVTIEEYRLRKL